MTEEVSRPERSSEVKALQEANIALMLVTEEVSRPERSSEVIDEQYSNISSMLLPCDLISI